MFASKATLDLKALKHNYLYAKKLCPKAKIYAVVKADAYGHGAVRVAKYLDEIVDNFAVSYINEALELRESGVKSPIVLLEGLFSEQEFSVAVANNFKMIVGNFEQVKYLKQADQRLTVFIKYNTGMNRLGFSDTDIEKAYHQLKKHKLILTSHFASADDLESECNQRQKNLLDNFNYDKNMEISFSNSAAILRQLVPHDDHIRPGILLYGSSPVDNHQNKLQPVMTLTAPIISINTIKKGEKIGYGGIYRCQKDTRIAVVAIGYADGYPRSAKFGTPVFVNNQKAIVVGRVSMSMITIDLENVKDVKIGDRVEVLGKNVLVNEVAKNSNTISHQILSTITSRVSKFYIA